MWQCVWGCNTARGGGPPRRSPAPAQPHARARLHGANDGTNGDQEAEDVERLEPDGHAPAGGKGKGRGRLGARAQPPCQDCHAVCCSATWSRPPTCWACGCGGTFQLGTALHGGARGRGSGEGRCATVCSVGRRRPIWRRSSQRAQPAPLPSPLTGGGPEAQGADEADKVGEEGEGDGHKADQRHVCSGWAGASRLGGSSGSGDGTARRLPAAGSMARRAVAAHTESARRGGRPSAGWRPLLCCRGGGSGAPLPQTQAGRRPAGRVGRWRAPGQVQRGSGKGCTRGGRRVPAGHALLAGRAGGRAHLVGGQHVYEDHDVCGTCHVGGGIVGLKEAIVDAPQVNHVHGFVQGRGTVRQVAQHRHQEAAGRGGVGVVGGWRGGPGMHRPRRTLAGQLARHTRAASGAAGRVTHGHAQRMQHDSTTAQRRAAQHSTAALTRRQ